MKAELHKPKDELVYDNMQQSPENNRSCSGHTTNRFFWPQQIWKRVVLLAVVGALVVVIIVPAAVVITETGDQLDFSTVKTLKFQTPENLL